MKLDRIRLSLQGLFEDGRRWAHRGRKLVFWYDGAGEFSADVEELHLIGVKVARMGETPFALKRLLLAEDPHSDYLLYAPHEEPEAAQNWLLDLQLTGNLFTADRAAMMFADLGFSHRPLEQTIRDHARFFRSEKRLAELRGLGLPKGASERELLAGLLAVAARSKEFEPRAVIRQVLLGGLSDQNPAWEEMGKLGLEAAFWELVGASVGFRAEVPTLRRLFISLLLAHFAHQLQGDLPAHLRAEIPPTTTPGYSLIAAWLRDSRDQERLRELTQEVEADLGIEEWAAARELSVWKGVETFPVLEIVALRGLVRALLSGTKPPEIVTLARERSELHYAARYPHEYRAVIAAAEFFRLREQFAGVFPDDAKLLLAQYVSDWHLLDRLYREYVTAADEADATLLGELTPQLERHYDEFQVKLNGAWNDAFDEKLPERLNALQKQWTFFQWHVRPLLERTERDRVVVIVSDALRYEVATELRGALVTELRGEAALGHMLSVLPSQTRWGMAALLPGEELAWDADTDRVLRSGLPTQQGDRETHLRRTGFPSLVMKLDELAVMSTEAARAALEGRRLVYLYHDAIDALGDKPASEFDVFRGCAAAVAELSRAVKRLVNSLNTSTVLVTADHGFLYQRQKIEDPDKVAVPVKGAGTKVDRRAMIATEPVEVPSSLHVSLHKYQNVSGPLHGFFPWGTLRYRIQGGSAQYAHGGASLQEMVVPVLTYRHKRSAPGVAQASRKVRVEVVSRSRRVTNNVFNVTLVQAEAVAERLRARTVTVQLVDAEGRAVTDQKALTLASTSPHPTERQQVARLSVTIPDPDDHATYFLTVTDTEDRLELVREPWEIRIAFKDDFGF
ncbi:BREX-1 system phosphatase PglZ type A [Deinococcus wulumuqiensis]|uniref:DNA repair protein n=1 Tax=Deinococcus wulumuqiensis TaxID=980427 RepID=A0AAV4K7F2_9DEIO|nr:BREX-1 system phosphatase PglZ type A [Deinococcus wulumuqiensis]QII22080.1 BREX-1 system phosphatase PglZ type A [Deinococcus wulumuqiensis R12]GGI84328.1 DNA repair protein [Deinococcus wulumuqiensis]GGP29771.1 DNA repair protein [Deinococcus wulumuqiensis]